MPTSSLSSSSSSSSSNNSLETTGSLCKGSSREAGGQNSRGRRVPLAVIMGGCLVAQAVLLGSFFSTYWESAEEGRGLTSSSSLSSSTLLLQRGAAPTSAVSNGAGTAAGSSLLQHNDDPTSSTLLSLLSSSPLVVPVGQPPNLPRIDARAKDNEHENEQAAATAMATRGIYGGDQGLGGFTEFDPDGISPLVWANMMSELGIRSMMDVGCGRGVSTRWFLEHSAKVLCVEGSHDAVTKSFLPSELIVEHDYSRGPWWPRGTYDAAWSVEFLEHVSRQYMPNYIQTLRKAAVIFVSSSRWGGWHHVEIHNDEWWIRKFASYGFTYDEKLTERVREWAEYEQDTSNYTLPNGDKPNAQHVYMSMKVFLNPAVASLPAHAHLFPEDGCLGDERPAEQRKPGMLRYVPRKCGTGPDGGKETPLPGSFRPLPVDVSMHEKWLKAIRAEITVAAPKDQAETATSQATE
jgi:SAM-dependent methyltransferase